MFDEGTTTCYARPDSLFWANTVSAFDCSSHEEDAIERCPTYAGNGFGFAIALLVNTSFKHYHFSEGELLKVDWVP